MRPPSAAVVLFTPDIVVVEVSPKEGLLLRVNETESGMRDGHKRKRDDSEGGK